MGGWMTRFYILFSTIFHKVISGRGADENERLCAMKPRLRLRKFRRAGLEPGTARSVGQHLTHWATGALVNIETMFI